MKGEAKVSHELEAQRGRDTKQFYMSDGSYTAVQYAQPVHYRKNGTWAEIDNTLTRAAEGYVNTASDVRFTFSDDTASLPVVRAQYEGCGITFISLEPAADAVQKSRKARRAAPLEAVRVENPAARADAAEQEEIAAAAKVETLNAGITYEGAPGGKAMPIRWKGARSKKVF